MNMARWLGGALCISVLAACTTTTVTNSSGEVVAKGSERSVARTGEADARTRARARADLAAGYYRTGQIAIALEEARRATTIDPAFAEAYGLLGLICMDMNDRREAEDNFQRALQARSGQPGTDQQLRLVPLPDGARARIDRVLRPGAARSALRHAGPRRAERR